MQIPLLAKKSAFPDGACTIADGIASVIWLVPVAESVPLPKFALKEETIWSPCVATNRAPVPLDAVVELLFEQAVIKDSRASRPTQERNFIDIPSPFASPFVAYPGKEPSRAAIEAFGVPICVSGLYRKSKLR
jgi:hypothetical protein